jgi:hypothetical protein
MKPIVKSVDLNILTNTFPIQYGLKQGETLSPLVFNFALEYALRKVQENHVGPKFNRTYQLLVYADDVNLLGDSIDTIQKNTETLIDACLQVNADKSKYTMLPRQQIAGQNHNIKMANRRFANVPQFIYLGTTVTY